jgi:hypothetical protein
LRCLVRVDRYSEAVRVAEVVRALAMRARGAVRALQPPAILAVGWALGLLYAWPGLMTFDSIVLLHQARDHVYTDGHPPVVAALWGLVDHVVPGSAGMLVLQTAGFVAGMYLVLRRVLSPRRAALAAVAIFLFPPVLCPLSVIWKDCIMAGALVLAIALLIAERRVWRFVGLGLLLLASAVRYNAPAATFAPVVLLFVWPGVSRAVARYAIAAGIWVGLTVGAIAINAALTDIHMHFWQSSLAAFDIAGTLAHVDGSLADHELRETLAGTPLEIDHDLHAAIRTRYAPDDFERLIAGDGRVWNLTIIGQTPAPAPQVEAMTRAFWAVVTEHPGAYLRHRVAVLLATLEITTSPGVGVITRRGQNRDYLHDLGLDPDGTSLQLALEHRFKQLAQRTPLFQPWIYVLLALALLAFAGTRLEVAVLLSGLGLESSLLLLAPTTDYRYSHWLVVCTLIAGVMVVARYANTVRTS